MLGVGGRGPVGRGSPDMARLSIMARRPRLVVLPAATALPILVLDQLTKWIAVDRLRPGVPVTVIDGWLQWRLVRNSGAAFSLGTGSTWIFTVIAVVVAIVIIRIARRIGALPWALGLGLLMGGLLGNLTDRIFRTPGVGRGHVVDFVEYLRFPVIDFPVFNGADSAIVCSAVLITLLGVLDVPLTGRTAPSSDTSSTEPHEDGVPRD